MTNDALRTILPIAGFSEDRTRAVEITGDADPILPTPFKIGETSAAALGAVGLAVSDLWELRTGRRQAIAVDSRQATASLRSGHYMKMDAAREDLRLHRSRRQPARCVALCHRSARRRQTRRRHRLPLTSGREAHDPAADLRSLARARGPVRRAWCRAPSCGTISTRHDMTTYYAAFMRPGSGWDPRKPVREQPLWDEHARYMDALFATGAVVLGGPFADRSGSLVILKAESATHAREMYRNDPWTLQDILVVAEVKEWTIFLDERNR